MLHEGLVVPVLMYGNNTMVWREKERSRIEAVQIGNFRSLLGKRRIDKCCINGLESCVI